MVEKIIWSKEASQDRNNIIAYWNRRNKSNLYSKKLLLMFKEATKTLKLFPAIGKPINRLNTKLKIVRDYFIVYRIQEDTIRILSVWDSRQDPSELDVIINK